MNTTYTVWTNTHTGVGEKCLKNKDGDYIGIETGKRYSEKDHYHSLRYNAIIKAIDTENKTGMYHLYKGDFNTYDDEENGKSFKEKYVGCLVTVEGAHYMGKLRVYRCVELQEYFSEDEIELINP